MSDYLPDATTLPRLEVPAKGGAWAMWQRLQSKRARRREFSWTMLRGDLDDNERLGRLRTLVDLGLWGDHTRRKDVSQERDMMGFDILRAQRECHCTQEVLHLALEAGVDPNWHEKNHYDDSLLTLFVRHNLPDCMKLVLRAGANPRWQDTCNKTALHLLVERATIDAEVRQATLPQIEHLLELGVDINDRGQSRYNELGAPPIRIAIEKWDAGLVRWMLGRGASLDVCDEDGDTPMHWVASAHAGWDEPDYDQMLTLLADHGAPLDKPNMRGETPAWTAMKWRNEKVGGWLLEHGASGVCVPHTFQDSNGYDHPGKPGESLLQVFCENIALTPHTADLILLLGGRGSDAWNTITPEGVPLHEALVAEKSPWVPFIQAQALDQAVQPGRAPSRRRRL